MISIVIPTYTAVDYLALALESITQNQFCSKNEIVVVVDGTFEKTAIKSVLETYKKRLNLKVVIFDENKGFAFALNFGFFNSSFPLVLAINDDNIMPKDFDKILVEEYEQFEKDWGYTCCLSPNQIEPRPSIFKPFIINSFGEEAQYFDLERFTTEELGYRSSGPHKFMEGWTFPFFISKNQYLAVGGFDILYPGNHVSDWDFFTKLDIHKIPSIRTGACNFYHFGSKSARTSNSYQQEIEAHAFFEYKWGFKAYNRLLEAQVI